MHEEIFRAVESGAVVVTASRRLAGVVAQKLHSHQKEQGRSFWKPPEILPLDAFLAMTWSEWVWRAAISGQEPCPALLNALQEQLVWEQVIRESPAGDSLLRIPETARLAMEAWRLALAYRLPVDGRFEAADDWSAFAAWSRAFRKRCEANNWMEPARLADFVAGRLRNGEIAPPPRLYLAGFDEFTPQQAELLDALGSWQEFAIPSFQSATQRWKLRDGTEEIRRAAAWARELIERWPVTQIGVIVPDLTSSRPKVERIFRETLDPADPLDDRERSFHLSLGPSLDRSPVVRAALLMLEFGLGARPLARAGRLLRSPVLGGGEAEWTGRALLDAKLRRDGVWDITVSQLRDEAGRCPLLQRFLRRFEKELAKLPREQRASEWSGDFVRLLEALGWPGDRPLSSREHQVMEAWHGLLSSVAALDVASAPMSFAEALARLQEIAAESTFQVENEGAPVQIMGMLEASGLRFDHLWIMGLHDEALPAAVRPNPFLPISLQREHKLPHSSAERELEFANGVMERLLASAPDVVLSYPETEGDRALGPSSLVTGAWLAAGDVARAGDWATRMRAEVRIEQLHDEKAPPVVAEFLQTGGAGLFKDRAACPFRAYAKHRLGARPLEETDLGLSYRDRGSSVHKALELIWSELGSHARLMELTAGELTDLIARSVDAAVERLGSGIGRNLERRRLRKLLAGWLGMQKSPQP